MKAVFMILLVVALANLLLALLVFWHKPKAEVNRVFALTALSVAGWTFTNALFQWTASVATATQMAALSYLSAIVLGASFLHFAWIFPRASFPSHSTRAIFFKVSLWVMALVVGCLGFVPGIVIQSVDITDNRFISTNAGVYAIALFMLLTSVWAFAALVQQHAQLHGVARAQSRYVLTGAALTAILGLIFNLLFPLMNNYAYVWLGPTASLFFVSFSIYAIIAKHLFDIRIIIKRTLVYTLLLAGITAGYSAVEIILTEAFLHAAQDSPQPFLANLGGAVVVSFLFTPLRRWLEKWLDKIVFGSQHTPEKEHEIINDNR